MSSWSRSRAASARFVALFTLAVLTSARAQGPGQGVKLNGPLARVLDGYASSVQCSPDGQRVVFIARMNSERSALFSVPAKGGTPVALVGEAAFSPPFRISPDSQFVHYMRAGLHVVPIDGSRGPQRIAEDALRFAYVPGSSVLLFSRATGIFASTLEGKTPVPVALPPAGTTVFDYTPLSVSADGRWVVFLTSSGVYSAAVDGSTGPLLLNDDPGTYQLEITPDNLRVVYPSGHGLFSVPIDGSTAPVMLSNPLPANRGVTTFAVSRDGSRALYLADQDRRNIFELYSAPVAGGEPAIKLNTPLGANQYVYSFDVADGNRVVYLVAFAELFVVDAAGTAAPVRLSHAGASIRDFALTADGRRAVYGLAAGTAPRDLFSVSLQRPGVAQRLTEVASGESASPFAIGPDSARVAYILDGQGDPQLYSVPISGGPRTRLDHGAFVDGFQFTPDSQRVVYQAYADEEAEGVEELFSVESDGGPAPVKLSLPLDDGVVLDDVTSFRFGARGTRGTFVVERYDDYEELHGVRLEPRTRPVRLATAERFEAAPGSPSAVLTSPDEEWVAYTIRDGGDGGGYFWLFGVPMDGSRPPEQLHPHPVTGVRFGPDGRTLFYSEAGGGTGIHRVPVDSSEPRRELTGWNMDDALPFELSPDGSTVVVLTDALVAGHYQLFSLPSDGSSPPVRLNDLTAPHGSRSYPFQITADGTRVIYATDGVTDEAVEIFSVPIDGSAAPVRISGPQPAGNYIFSFELVPQANRVVFLRYDRDDAENQYELWSVPMDGSAPPVRLHGALPAGGDVDFAYRVVHDGTQVAFRADLAADERYELFLAPIDGSAAPRRLNGMLAAGGDVTAFELDGTGTRAVYRADEKQDEVFELFSAPLGAPAAPLQLTGPHVAGGDVVGFRTVPGGKHVVFTADHDTDEVFELYVAPVDQIKAARKLSGELVEHGDVEPAFSVESGGKVVYIADQDEDSVLEVYLSTLASPRASRSGAPPPASR